MFYYYRRQIKTVVLLLVVAGAVYGGIKAVMHYKVTRALDNLALEAAGRAELTYGKIETDIIGEVRVHNLSVLPADAPEPIAIDMARVTGPNVGFFLWGQKDDEPPPRLKLELLGVSLPLQAGMFDSLQAQMEIDVEPVSQDSCSSNSNLDPALLSQLGLTALNMDLDLSYDYDAKRRNLNMAFGLDIQDIENIQAGMSLADVAPEIFEGGGQMDSIPSLAGMNLDIRVEPAFAERYLGACAERRGQDLETYRQTLVAETLNNLSATGIQLGVGLTQALTSYHQQWGDLSITIDPAEPINLMGMLLGSQQNWQRKLGVSVAMNGSRVSDLSFEVRPPNASELAVLMGEEAPPPPPKPRDRYRYVYHTVPAGSLNQHIGAEIRLHLRDDQPTRSGILMGVVANEARVEQRLHGGKITAHVPLLDIVKLEVRKVEKISPQ